MDRVEDFAIETASGPARAVTYSTEWDPMQQLAVVFGDIRDGKNVLVRLHVESVVDDAFGGSDVLRKHMQLEHVKDKEFKKKFSYLGLSINSNTKATSNLAVSPDQGQMVSLTFVPGAWNSNTKLFFGSCTHVIDRVVEEHKPDILREYDKIAQDETDVFAQRLVPPPTTPLPITPTAPLASCTSTPASAATVAKKRKATSTTPCGATAKLCVKAAGAPGRARP